MLKVKNLTHYYGPHKAIDDLNFHVEPGRLVGFLGPNGAGKTTTMKILSGFTMPSQGELWISDVSMISHPSEAKKYIGYLPENPPLYPEMTVVDYLIFVARLKGMTKTEAIQSVEEMIDVINLRDVVKRPIYKLSKGYRQRVGLAQAFVSKSGLIILDEPTVGFDPQQASDFRRLLTKMRGRFTIIWSTHILSDVESTCDEIIVINKGRIIAHGTYADITRKIRGSRVLKLHVKSLSDDFAKAIQTIYGVSGVSLKDSTYSIQYSEGDITDQVLAKALQFSVGIIKVESDSQDLEGLFLELTNKNNAEVTS